MSKVPSWNEERTDTLISIVGDTQPVSQETVKQAAESLETTERSVASKLRNLKYEVESATSKKEKTYTDAEEKELRNFVESNSGKYNYAEVAAQVLNGSRSPKQIQGKILSMDLYSHIKRTEKVEEPKKYTEAEEEKLLGLVRKGGFIEDIADEMNRDVRSIRGKILSLSREHDDISIPKQKNYKTKKEDAFTALGDVSEMTDEEIATAIDKSVRGVRTLLTHRGVDCKNYKGKKKKESNMEKKAAAAAG